MPADIVIRRFVRGLGHLAPYAAEMDLWRVYDASGPQPRLAAEGAHGRTIFEQPEVLATLPQLSLPHAPRA